MLPHLRSTLPKVTILKFKVFQSSANFENFVAGSQFCLTVSKNLWSELQFCLTVSKILRQESHFCLTLLKIASSELQF